MYDIKLSSFENFICMKNINKSTTKKKEFYSFELNIVQNLFTYYFKPH